MIDNKGKVAIIFGIRNEHSIAYHIAKRLHQSGCRVVVSYLPETRDEVLYLLEKDKIDATYAAMVDVRHETEIHDFVRQIYDHIGPIDYILHGVAFGNQQVLCYPTPGNTQPIPSYIDIPFEDFMDSFNISAYSLLRICRVTEQFMSPHASVLTLTYNASQRVFPGYAGMAICKAALENIMLYLSNYFRKSGARVNAISAGLVMTTSAGAISGVRKLRKLGKHTAPLGNVTASDIADAALYYFSDLSKKVTGNIHFVDGGFNIMGVGIEDEK